MRDREYRLYRLSFSAAIAVSLLFVVLTVPAMFLYGGGTQDDSTMPGYSFWENYFSDLGRTTALSWAPNTASYILFTAALLAVGLIMVTWFLTIPVLFTRTRIARWLSYPAALSGALAGIAFVHVALTPSNLDMDRHMDHVYAGFLCFSIAVLLLTLAMFLEKRYPRVYPAVSAIFLLLLVTYNWMGTARPVFGGFSSLAIQATSQKIIVYAMVFCTGALAHGSIRVLKKLQSR
ncbi:MAG: DUF998 domain-containing protein [Firmicutes bacterium]|nr:DUF998 domain-containing protein [Bacillota bacterium]